MPKFKSILRRIGIVLLGVSVLSLTHRSWAATSSQLGVEELITQLADPDPTVRDAAQNRLSKIGSRNREALIKACESPVPEVRARASKILLMLAWYRPTDNPEIRRLLLDYGKQPASARTQILAQLSKIPNVQKGGIGILLRLINEEPSVPVRWAITILLQNADGQHRDPICAVDPGHTNAPLIAAAAWAWEAKDHTKSDELYERLIDLELRQPTPGSGPLLAQAFDSLINSRIRAGRFDEAAHLRRQQIARLSTTERSSIGFDEELDSDENDLDGDGFISSDERRISFAAQQRDMAVALLFALHADYGPAKGFADDLVEFAPHLQDPVVLYAMSKMFERQGSSVLAGTFREAAFARGNSEPESHRITANLLMHLNWNDLARREYEGIAAMNTAANPWEVGYAFTQLAKIAEDEGDLKSAVELARKGMLLMPGNEEGADQKVSIELNLLSLKLARQSNDAEGVKRHATDLATRSPNASDIDLVGEMVRALKETGHTDRGKTIFAEAYQIQLAQIQQDPENPVHQNNIAWLSARSGERLAEALKYASQAVEAEPENGADLDTLGDVYFNLGQYDRAIEVETKALYFRGKDSFIEAQLRRFHAAKEAAATQPVE